MKRTVLLIDDNKKFSRYCKMSLEKAGYDVGCLHSPEEASFETQCHARYSHILVDFEYKGSSITGEDVGQQLRWKWPLVPLILITAYMNQEDARGQFIRVGWDGCFDKEAAGVGASGIRERLIQVLREAEESARKRISREFPITDNDCIETMKRLDAVEKACRSNAGKKSGSFDDKELIQAACIFFSSEQEQLTEQDLEDLRGLRGNKRDDKEVWKRKEVKMTLRNAWSPYFQIRGEARQGDDSGFGKLMIAGLRARHLIINHPGRWPLTCQRYGPLSKVVEEFGLGAWVMNTQESLVSR